MAATSVFDRVSSAMKTNCRDVLDSIYKEHREKLFSNDFLSESDLYSMWVRGELRRCMSIEFSAPEAME